MVPSILEVLGGNVASVPDVFDGNEVSAPEVVDGNVASAPEVVVGNVGGGVCSVVCGGGTKFGFIGGVNVGFSGGIWSFPFDSPLPRCPLPRLPRLFGVRFMFGM